MTIVKTGIITARPLNILSFTQSERFDKNGNKLLHNTEYRYVFGSRQLFIPFNTNLNYSNSSRLRVVMVDDAGLGVEFYSTASVLCVVLVVHSPAQNLLSFW